APAPPARYDEVARYPYRPSAPRALRAARQRGAERQWGSHRRPRDAGTTRGLQRDALEPSGRSRLRFVPGAATSRRPGRVNQLAVGTAATAVWPTCSITNTTRRFASAAGSSPQAPGFTRRV